MKDSNFNDPEKQNLDDLFKTLNINSSSTPFPNAMNMTSNSGGHTAFTQKDIRGGDNSYLSGGGVGSAYFDGLRNYFTDNRSGYGTGAGGGGMQDVSVQRGSGGTGGGSEDSVDNMGGNQLLQLNPYVSKNVVSFNDGGMFGEFAKYNHGGNVGSVGSDGTKYSVEPYEKQANSPGYNGYLGDGGREKNRINEIRRKEFMEQNNLNPYHVRFTSDPRADSPYMNSFKAEQVKRRGTGGTGGGSNPTATEAEASRLKNPWEEGYDGWYVQAKNGMRMPKYNHGGTVGSMGLGGESWRYEQNKLGSGNTYTASSRRYNPEVVRLEEKARRDQFMSQNNLPHGFSSSDERGNPYKTSFRAEQDRRQNERWLEAIKTNNPNSHNIPFESLKNPWEEGYDNWYGQAENGMRMPKYNDGGMMQQQQMPQQTESYAKQANDMIALAQLEAFGKKFLSQTKGEIPPEIAQAMNQQGMPQAANGMKRLYQQGGNYPHNMYNKETGYKIVAEEEAAHTKLAGAGFDHTPKAKYGMKMKRYTQGGRF